MAERRAPESAPTPGATSRALLDAAAAVFVASGVDAPVRDIAAEAGVGMGTIYRHFPTRADLVIAVYRHQVEACAEAGRPCWRAAPRRTRRCGGGSICSSTSWSPSTGSPRRCSRTSARFETLHAYFLDRLVPVCAQLLDAAAAAGEIRADVDAYELMRGVGNLCVGARRPALRRAADGRAAHRRAARPLNVNCGWVGVGFERGFGPAPSCLGVRP